MVVIQNIVKNKLSLTFITFFLCANITSIQAVLAVEEAATSKPASLSSIISDDYSSYFSHDRLLRMGIAFGLGGIAANTNIDMNIRNGYQDRVRTAKTNIWSNNNDNIFSFNAKFFGEGKYMIPVALLAASVNYIDTDTPIGSWGANTSRAFIVGLPPMWAMQIATGASRPGETPQGSVWRPFKDDNGVSGHSFVGTVPFLTIAAMNADNPYIKYPAYLASAAAGWSRINDDKHFFSQVVLGWYMAYEAVDTVFENNHQKKGITLAPMVGIDGFGLIASGKW